MKKTFGLNKLFKHKSVLVSPITPNLPATEGLIMHLDTSNSSSYSGTGTNIFNLVGNNWGTLGGNYSFSNGTIRLVNNNPNMGYNNSRINLPNLSNIRTVSLWFKYEGGGRSLGGNSGGYLIDARFGLSGGFAYPDMNLLEDWSTLYVNGVSVARTWSNIHPPVGVWRNITLVSNRHFNDDMNLFSRFSNDEGYDVTFGCALIYDEVVSEEQNLQNFNALKGRFGL